MGRKISKPQLIMDLSSTAPEKFPKLGSKSVDRPLLKHDWNAVGRREERKWRAEHF